MPAVDVAPLITGDLYDAVVEVAGDTDTLTEASLINNAVALGNRIEYVRRRSDAAMRHPESIVSIRDDFLLTSASTGRLQSELVWAEGAVTGGAPITAIGSLPGTSKNPGQLTIITDSANDSGRCFYLGDTNSGACDFGGARGFEQMTIVLKAVGNTNVGQRIAFGLTDDRLDFLGTDSIQVFIDQTTTGPDWGLKVRKAGAGSASLGVLAPFVSQEFITVDFIRNAALGLDVYCDSALILTVAAADLPNGGGVWGGYVKNGPADTDPLTVAFDFFHYRGAIGSRSGL